MHRHLFPILALLAVLPAPAIAQPLFACGGDEVFLFDVAAAEKGKFARLWSWRARDREELPALLRKRFGTTDDCRPTDGGRTLMVSSSGGAVALVDRPSGKVLWYASVPNAHGIEALPGGRVIAASSLHPLGNRLMLFERGRPDVLLWDTPLHSAHGVVWDASRQRLWALGHDVLRSYSLRDWETKKPSLVLQGSYHLPDPDGHDLSEVPGSNDLVVTTHRHVFLFDREKGTFRKHPELGELARVKGVAIHPGSGRIAVTQAIAKEWWTPRLDLLAPRGKVVLAGERLYRIRWLDSPAAGGRK